MNTREMKERAVRQLFDQARDEQAEFLEFDVDAQDGIQVVDIAARRSWNLVRRDVVRHGSCIVRIHYLFEHE